MINVISKLTKFLIPAGIVSLIPFAAFASAGGIAAVASVMARLEGATSSSSSVESTALAPSCLAAVWLVDPY